ncbi:MAG: hypothetical protein IJ588_12520 [Prevotella sp.]|nr:hypothetical protein [Prevotella sp.]
MEREELLQQVNESLENDGKKLSSTLSEETINGELDDALEDMGDDAEANKAVVAKLAKRLLRMDGNLHSNVSKEVTAYKQAHQKKTGAAGQKGDGGKGEGDGDGDDAYKQLLARVEAMENAQKQKAVTDAKDAVRTSVKKGVEAKFKEANIEVNQYIFKQTMRDLEIPDAEEGKKVDESALIKQLERDYFKNLKEAGLDKKDTGKAHRSQFYGGKGKSQLDAMFEKKKAKEGWGQKN